MPGAQADTIEGLRARIAALEKRAPLAGDGGRDGRFAGTGILDLVASPDGLLQEVFADDRRSAGAGLGFILGAARGRLTPGRPALIYLQLVADAQETGVPYAPGFADFGIETGQMVMGRVETVAELLWAMEEALNCRAVAAVIADVPGADKTLDFTVSRRLNLKTAATGTTAYLLRYGMEREASAAVLRWRVGPSPAAPDRFDPQAPGPPRFAVMLEKSRMGAWAQRLEGQGFALDWVNHGFVVVERGAAERAAAHRRTPASRAQPAAVGNRLHQAG